VAEEGEEGGMTDPWIEQARQPIAHVAQQLGYPSRNRHYPCPAKCDGRTALPVYATDKVWRCARCDAKGDAIDLIAYVLHGGRWSTLAPDQKSTVRQWFGAPARSEYRPPPERQVTRPSPAALEAFWQACGPIDGGSAAFIRSRGLDPAALAPFARSVRQGQRSDFWRAGKGRTWRLVCPGYVIRPDGVHEMANVHARAITDPPGEAPKALWCRGLSSSGVVMWNGVDPSGACLVLVTEGVTDYWTACVAGLRSTCIYSATSGGFVGLANMRTRSGVSVVIAPHAGDIIAKGATMGAGDKYEQEIRKALPARDVRRVRLPDGVDVNDWVRGGGTVRGLVAGALAE
jgi:hypothetical protein